MDRKNGTQQKARLIADKLASHAFGATVSTADSNPPSLTMETIGETRAALRKEMATVAAFVAFFDSPGPKYYQATDYLDPDSIYLKSASPHTPAALMFHTRHKDEILARYPDLVPISQFWQKVNAVLLGANESDQSISSPTGAN